jgi:hypothetical protein
MKAYFIDLRTRIVEPIKKGVSRSETAPVGSRSTAPR